MSFNGVVVIVYVKGSPYTIHFWHMSKNDAISIMNSSNLVEKKVFYNFFYYVWKMSKKTYYQRSREVILNRA